MVFNFTFQHNDLRAFFEIADGIVPLTTTFLLVIIPFVLFYLALARFGQAPAFATSSFLSTILAVMFVGAGIVPQFILPIFIAMSIIGLIWISIRDNPSVQ